MPMLTTVLLLLILWSSASAAEERFGIVLLHGKESAPEEHGSLADAMAAAGHLVERPEMCWSGGRIYDRPYLDCVREIDNAVARLNARGARAVAIAGHSLGANGAAAYAAGRTDLQGIIMMAPGHRPEVLSERPQIASALRRARSSIEAGHGGRQDTFPDFNGNMMIDVRTTPNIYVSFMAADSPARMDVNVARLAVPLLYIVGTNDPFQFGPSEIFARAPPRPLNRYLTVRAGHFETAAASAPAVIAWLKELAPK